MTKEELIEQLEDLLNDNSKGEALKHMLADGLLLEYINDDEVLQAYDRIPKNYS